jgi:hypothetical protein
MKKQVILLSSSLFLCFILTLSLNAQQTKRNMIANADFEEGFVTTNDATHVPHPKNWRTFSMNGAKVQFTPETGADRISGDVSLKVNVAAPAAGQNPLASDAQLYYYIPLKNSTAYSISFKIKGSVANSVVNFEFCRKYGSYSAFSSNVNLLPDGFSSSNYNADGLTAILRGTLAVGTTVKEYVFTSNASTGQSDPRGVISFHFGAADPGNYWIDDVKVSYANGDWDGNLLSPGNFENINMAYGEEAYAFGFIRPANEVELTAEYTDVNGIAGKSLHVTKKAGTDYWNHTFQVCTWSNEGTDTEISFKAKSNAGSAAKIRTCTNSYFPWNAVLPEGDATDKTFNLTAEPHTYSLNSANDYGVGKHKNSGYFKYRSVTGANAFDMDYDGSQVLTVNFDMTTPVGKEYWVDDIVVKEHGLYLEDVTVVNPPTSVNVGGTVQFKIGAFVKPTHADPTVKFEVENGTGSATIDQDGVLTGVAAGTVNVYISDPDDTFSKSFPLTVGGGAGFAAVETAQVSIYPSAVNAGETVRIAGKAANVKIYSPQGVALRKMTGVNFIETAGLSSGVYLAVIEVNGKPETKRFIVK